MVRMHQANDRDVFFYLKVNIMIEFEIILWTYVIKSKYWKYWKRKRGLKCFGVVQLNLIDEGQNSDVKTYNLYDDEMVKIYSRPMLYCAI